MSLSRRALLVAAAAAPFAGHAARAAPAPRVAALNWTAAMNLAAIGLPPVCAPELALYAQFVVEPALPPATLETGLRPEPNLERLVTIAPDLIVIDGELENVRPRLERIAPVVAFDGFVPGSPDHFARGVDALGGLAASTGRAESFAAWRTAAEATIETARQRLRGYDGRPLLLTSIVDSRRALVFGGNSLFQTILDRLGLANAWKEPTSAYGHSVVTLDRLAAAPEARFVNVGNERISAREPLMAHPVVGSLAAVREGRITTLPAILFYGGAPAAVRFARLLGERLPAATAG